MSLEDIINIWKKEKELYELLTSQIESQLDEVTHDKGISVRILARTKKDDNLIKKFYRKKNFSIKYYSEMSDKSAARVICKIREDLKIVEECIFETFEVCKKEDKGKGLEIDRQGYKSIHFDVKLKKEKTLSDVYEKIGTLKGEIQVRTLCEDTWAEIYHDLGYKPSGSVSEEVDRQFYCIAGLLEVADGSFSGLVKITKDAEILNEEVVLMILATYHYKIIRSEFDQELSRYNLSILLPLIKDLSPKEFKVNISKFMSVNGERIGRILTERGKFTINPYKTQPELFLIFYLIETNPYSLIEKWHTEDLFQEDLDDIFNWFGVPISDFCH